MSNDTLQKRNSDTTAEKLPKKKAKTVAPSAAVPTPAADAASVAVVVEPTGGVVEQSVKKQFSFGQEHDVKLRATATSSGDGGVPINRISCTQKNNVIPIPPTTPGVSVPATEGAQNASSRYARGEANMDRTDTINVVTPEGAARPVSTASTDSAASNKSPPKEQPTKAPGGKCSSLILVGVSAMLVLSNLLSLGLWVQSRLDTELQVRELALVAGADNGELSYGGGSIVALSRIFEGLGLDNKSLTLKVDRLKGDLELLVDQKRLLDVEKVELQNALQELGEKHSLAVQVMANDSAEKIELQNRLEKQRQQNAAELEKVIGKSNVLRSKLVKLEGDLRAQRDAHAAEVNDWNTRRRELEEGLQNLEAHANGISEERDHWVQATRNAETERDEWRDDAEQAARDREAWTLRAQELERELETVEREMEELQRLREQVHVLEEKNVRLEEECAQES
ncbi:hypothetical protein ACA910_015209 [Epithemia clementina (nom. ined.)]